MPARGNKLLLDLYRTMRRIRTFEERVNELFVRGQTAGSMLHMSIGEEAISGVCEAMERGDSFTTHRRRRHTPCRRRRHVVSQSRPQACLGRLFWRRRIATGRSL